MKGRLEDKITKLSSQPEKMARDHEHRELSGEGLSGLLCVCVCGGLGTISVKRLPRRFIMIHFFMVHG